MNDLAGRVYYIPSRNHNIQLIKTYDDKFVVLGYLGNPYIIYPGPPSTSEDMERYLKKYGAIAVTPAELLSLEDVNPDIPPF